MDETTEELAVSENVEEAQQDTTTEEAVEMVEVTLPDPEAWHPLTRLLVQARDEGKEVELAYSERAAVLRGVPVEVLAIGLPYPCVTLESGADRVVVLLSHLRWVSLADQGDAVDEPPAS